MPEKFEGGTPPQERGETERKVLAFEGREVFNQSPEQIEAIRMQMDSARTALKTDMDSVASRDVYGMALEGGVEDQSYSTVRYGTISKYSGEAQIEINGRKYKAEGRGPRGTAACVSKYGFIEFIPQEVPPTTKEGEPLSPEQESLLKMSRQQLDSLNRRVSLAEKALSQGFDQFTADELKRLALEHGIEDISYNTVRWGTVSKYSGEAEIVIKGQKYKAIGHGPKGTAAYISIDGYIEWQLVEGHGE